MSCRILNPWGRVPISVPMNVRAYPLCLSGMTSESLRDIQQTDRETRTKELRSLALQAPAA